MNKQGPIVIIEDDVDDREILSEIFNSISLENEVKFFGTGHDALSFLENTDEHAFLIFSDFNMPLMSGVEVKEAIMNSTQDRIKAIPFVFFTTAAPKKAVLQAYQHCAQGFFLKPNSYSALKELVFNIITYWKTCEAPL